VQLGHAVAEARQAQGQHGHAEEFAVVALVFAAQGHEDLEGQAQLAGVALKIGAHEVYREAVVAGGYRRVRGEHAGGGGELRGRLKGQAVVLHVHADAFQPGKGRVALVHVDDHGLYAQHA